MADQVRQLDDLGVPALLLNSSQDSVRAARDLAASCAPDSQGILYVAPERFAAPSFRACCRSFGRACSWSTKRTASASGDTTSAPNTCVWPRFAKRWDRRSPSRSPRRRRRRSAATSSLFLKLRSPKMHVTGFDRPNLRYAAALLSQRWREGCGPVARSRCVAGTGIIYCATRKTVEELTA